jgi:seryl-tRNA synthetase
MEAQKKLAAEAETEKATMLNKIGNILSADVVISKTEDDNKVIRTWGTVNKEFIVDGS